MPQTPCRQFYISHLHNQPWIQGNYSDLLMSLSAVYSELRGDVAAGSVEEAEEEDYRYSTTKYWVRMSDVSAVKHHILQHLPVYQYSDVSWGQPEAGLKGHGWEGICANICCLFARTRRLIYDRRSCAAFGILNVGPRCIFSAATGLGTAVSMGRQGPPCPISQHVFQLTFSLSRLILGPSSR